MSLTVLESMWCWWRGARGAAAELQELRAALAAAQAELAALRTERAAAERAALLRGGLAAGQLTPALVAQWAQHQDAATLAAFLAHAPAGHAVPGGRLSLAALPGAPAAPDPAATRIARQCGVDPARVAATAPADFPTTTTHPTQGAAP